MLKCGKRVFHLFSFIMAIILEWILKRDVLVPIKTLVAAKVNDANIQPSKFVKMEKNFCILVKAAEQESENIDSHRR